ncbi:hypothetical protein AAG570_010352 [Ranatra chinensis]|uniref:Growth hormone-regulated TBC protein 1 n=1 Tax=Ranatra chinensis TaxID=642074 RepID=A0ABD0Z0G6_9HEMI
MSEYLRILAKRAKKWAHLMKSGRPLVKGRRLKRYIRKGIPNEYRPAVWLQVSGANDKKSELEADLYIKLLAGKHDTTMMETIRTDLPRTFPDNIFFSAAGEYQERLYRVLIAYGHHNKTVGYCQGLNYIVGLLLLVTKSEETSFWLLKMLVEKILPDYYSPTMDGLVTDIEVITELVSTRYPDVSAHLNTLGLPWPVVITKWLICLFCEVLPTETVLRVWDCLFNEGSKILFRVTLTVIGSHRDELMACDQFGDLAECLKIIVKDAVSVNCHTFIEVKYINETEHLF